MKPKQAGISKISRPRLPKIVQRKRLFRLLDRSSASVTWISGPAGCGKTTLVASWLDDRELPSIWYSLDEGDSDIATFFYYLGLAAKKAAPRFKRPLPLLTPEYAQGIPTFTRRYFENLCARLKSPSVIVFDNYQEVPDASSFHEVIATGLAALPEGIRAVVVSRTEPAPAMVRLRAANSMQAVDREELKLTIDETRGIVRLYTRKQKEENIREIHELTQGWTAGLVLMTAGKRVGATAPAMTGQHTPGEIFEYFGNVIFRTLDSDLRDFLLKTALLPAISVPVAEELTGNKNAARILADLSRSNYFTEKRQQTQPTYQYHPLFREFLIFHGKTTFTPADAAGIRKQAAKLLEESGRIEDAADLYSGAGDREGLTSLILAHGRSLAKQGRNTTLEKWLAEIPQQVIDKEPWLLYWLGVCRQPFNPPDSRTCFERAFQIFKARKNSLGIYLSWSAIVDTFHFEWNNFMPLDRWIKRLDGYRRARLKFPSPEIEARVAASMTAALMIRQPHRPDIARWLDLVLSLTRRLADPDLRVHHYSLAINYYHWTGNFEKIKSITEEIRAIARPADASPLAKITWLWLETGMDIYVLNSPAAALRSLSRALALADSSGVHIWDHMLFAHGVYCALVQGDFEKAEGFLMRVEVTLAGGCRHGYCHYHFLAGWLWFLKGDLSQAAHHARTAMAIAEETGYVFPVIVCGIEIAQVLHALGMDREARVHISRSHQFAIQARSRILEHMCLATKAWIAFDRGEEKNGFSLLRNAMKIGRENGYFTDFWWWNPSVTAQLCVKALEAGIETDYAQKIIRVHNLIPQTPPYHLENWPWPVRILTLGEFRLSVDDKPVRFSGKVQKKPLEMLKALISFRGRAGDAQLIEALWPDSDGDAAQQSFRTTLHRLRQLVGKDEAIQVRDGQVSLDKRYCWIDAWALLEAAQSADCVVQGKKSANAQRLEKAVQMYRGHFLADDLDKPWAVSLRERLKGRFVQAVSGLGEILESKKEWKKAIAAYERGLEVDDLAEELYRRLMECHMKLGRRADAACVYERCRNNLLAAFGVEPSDETNAVYRKMKDHDIKRYV